MRTDLSRLQGLWYAIIGYAACAYAVAHYVCWTLPRAGWLYYTGQIPPPAEDPSR